MLEIFNSFLEMMNTNNIFAYSMVLFYGLLIGSFLNVVIYRLPIMMNNEYLGMIKDITELDDETLTSKMNKEEKEEYYQMRKMKDLTLSFPSSRCCSCGKKIPIWHNIPVLSYLILRGKCHSCKAKYSPLYLFIELAVGLFWCFNFYMFGATIQFLLITLLFTGLIASAAIDFKHRILPDSITFGGLFLGLYYNITQPTAYTSPESAITGVIGGYIIIWSIVKGWEKLRNLDVAMGEGDLKLYAMCAAWVGFSNLWGLFIISALIGLAQFILLLPFKKNLGQYQLPFGPAIIASLGIYLYYPEITNTIISFLTI